MIIKQLKLSNIRSYPDAEVNFPEGTTLLSGDIGSGKTTLLMAIEFALFGADTNKLSGGALLRNGAQTGTVQLTFELSGKTYTIQRGIKKTSKGIAQTEGHFIVDGVRSEGVATELRARMLELLAYPPELLSKKKNLLFHYTVYCPQEEMKQILSENDDSRLDTLRKIFNVDKYKLIRENCAVYLRLLNSKIREHELRSENIEILEAEKKNVQEQRQHTQTQLTETEQRLGQHHAALETIHAEYIQLKKRAEEKLRLERELHITKTRLKEKEQQLFALAEKKQALEAKRAALPTISVTSAELKTTIEEQEKQLNEHSRQAALTNQQTLYLNQRRKELENELTTLRHQLQQLPTLQENLKALQTELAKLADKERQKEETETALHKLALALHQYTNAKENALAVKEAISKLQNCPTCLQQVPHEHKEKIITTQHEHALTHEKNINLLTQEKTTKEQQLMTLRQELLLLNKKKLLEQQLITQVTHITQFEQQLTQRDELLKKIKSDQEQLLAKEQEHKNFPTEQKKQELLQLKKTLEQHTQRELLVEQISAISVEIEGVGHLINALREETTAIHQSLTNYQDQQEKIKTIEEKLSAFQKQEQLLLIEKTRLAQDVSHHTQQLERLDKEITERRSHLEKKHRLSQLANWLQEFFIPVTGTIEKQVMQRIHHEFDTTFSDWFGMLLDEENVTARVSDTFLPLIQQNGYDVEIDHLSGGERTSAALAYRLALNKVVTDLSGINTKDLIILDEPTEGFSTEQLDKVREVLEQVEAKQIIIVSHESKIESFVDNVIRVEKGEQGSRVITV